MNKLQRFELVKHQLYQALKTWQSQCNLRAVKVQWWCKPGSIPQDAFCDQVHAWYQQYWIEVGTMGEWKKTGHHVFSDRNYAGDPVSKGSISGFISYVLGLPFSLQSKMTLSSLEAEWAALLEAVK